MGDFTLYLVRHGEILSNREDIYAGASDEELTPPGAESANDFGREAASWNIDAVYSSPVRRAVQTAEIINSHLGKELVIDGGFGEIKMGPWEGLRIKDVAERFPEDFKVWMTRPGDLRVRGRESLGELQTRAVESVLKIKAGRAATFKTSNSCPVLAVSHVAVIRVLFLYYNNRPLNEYKKIKVANLSAFKLVFSDTGTSFEAIEK
ncbi:hypothetical protein MNBD_DELTA02-605 [hydrothermal vent metagenome]|uniref:Histidine phosphatase family protein n=1 Tax=hydrothermal vent metagenome TaxID=652676 RepID=A0A3B0W567_9ZZZZ